MPVGICYGAAHCVRKDPWSQTDFDSLPGPIACQLCEPEQALLALLALNHRREAWIRENTNVHKQSVLTRGRCPAGTGTLVLRADGVTGQALSSLCSSAAVADTALENTQLKERGK